MKRNFEEIYLNFGVYNNTTLFIADSGFAAEAWKVSNKKYADIAASSFMAITGDDCHKYNIGRYRVRRLDNIDEFTNLLKLSHPAFRRIVELWDVEERVVSRMDLQLYKSISAKSGGKKKYSDIYGVHKFSNEDGLWTHEFAIFNENQSNLPEKVFEEFKNSLPTWDDVCELANKISGYMTREDCEKRLEDGLYVFELYCQ